MLICPLCSQPLADEGASLRCPDNHSFDRARQGYVNLLPVQHKASRAPGDNARMVEARRTFLSAGHYRPVADFLCSKAMQLAPRSWLDIGCGEGYYSDFIQQCLPQARGHALDISKEAVRHACRRNRAVNWLVASMARVPLADRSCELITSLFSPLDWQESRRLLAPGGSILHLAPAHDHLIELRQLIYDEVRPYDDAKHLQDLPESLTCVHSETLRFTLELPDTAQRQALLEMTPHGWRARQERRDAILSGLLQVTVAVRLDHIKAMEN